MSLLADTLPLVYELRAYLTANDREQFCRFDIPKYTVSHA